MTEWREVPGTERRYEVSDDGRVRSYVPWRKAPIPHELMPALNGHGYRQVGIDGHFPKVGELVLLAFVGPRPEGMDHCHRDGNKQNNRLENLRWDTRGHNIEDQVAHGTHHNARKTHCDREHEFTPENTRMRGRKRECIACSRLRSRKAV